MLSVIVFTCPCGCMVKAMYDTNGTTMVRCPNPSCTCTHPIDGHVVQMWSKQTEDLWLPQDVDRFVVPAA